MLIEFFRSLKLWLDEAAVAPANRAKVWKRWFSKPRKGPLARGRAQELSAEREQILADLEELLHAQDNAEIERRLQIGSEQSSESKASLSVQGPPAAPVKAGLSAGASSSNRRTEEMLEKLRRSKANYLHRRILEYQKVGTIRHRSSWYVRGDPAIGTKLGDDADEVNLDITLEKYRTAKTFLTRVFGEIASECVCATDRPSDRRRGGPTCPGFRRCRPLRLLHLVKSRVTVPDRRGKIYEAYLLDLSQYTGERKKRGLTILEFWKTGSEDELRRTALIYDPS